jgi:hypothetical protein
LFAFVFIAQSVGTNGGKSFFLNIKTTVIDSYMNFVRNLPNTDSIKSDPFLREYYMKILGMGAMTTMFEDAYVFARSWKNLAVCGPVVHRITTLTSDEAIKFTIWVMLLK